MDEQQPDQTRAQAVSSWAWASGLPLIGKSKHPEVWLGALIILVGAFAVAPGFVSIDEAIHYLGARAVAEHRALGIDNGFGQFHSEALRLRLLLDGPQGLTPQYPAGSALIAGILLPLLGPRAFVLLNALAAIGVLFTTWKICIAHFRDPAVARLAVALLVLATFWVEYAVGVWPHAMAAFFVVQAYWYATRHLSAPGDHRDALLAGLFAGAGMLFRLDAFLAVPAIGMTLVLFAPRFIRSSALFAVGALPAIALSSLLNWLKFGSPNPFSYGQSGGNTDIAAYGPLAAALVVGAGLLLLVRQSAWRPTRKVVMPGIAIVGIVLLLMPLSGPLLLRALEGIAALVFDIRLVDDPRFGIQPGPGGTLLFWGMAKKALGQSMPWIAISAMLLTAHIRRSERADFAMLCTFIVTIMTPFILLAWHGGGGSNMRYFLPALPPLCVLCAKLIHDLWQDVSRPIVFVAIGVWGAIVISSIWVSLDPSRFIGLQQIMSTYVLAATAVAAVIAGIAWAGQDAARKLTLTLVAVGLTMSFAFALSDFRVAADRRSGTAATNRAVAALPARSLLLTFPAWAAIHLPSNGSIVAERHPETQMIDHRLVLDALDRGYRVFIPDFRFEMARDVPPGVEAVPSPYTYPRGRIFELRKVRENPAGVLADGTRGTGLNP